MEWSDIMVLAVRDFMDINPLLPILLFFPQKEQSFSVDELISYLKGKSAKIHQFKGLHGFSDPYSQKYNKEAAQKAFGIMVDFLLKHKSNNIYSRSK